ncbi:hypothetical protein CR513_44383, partial [Mucuna pruriens]
MKMAEQREEELRQQIASLKARNEQEQEVRGEHLAQPLWRQPFCEEIDEARIPLHFREMLVDPFDGTQDPHAHLQAFQTQMYISGGDDKLSCKLFPGTLRGVALQWIMNLPPRSIYAFSDLAGLFLSQFAANKPKCLEVADLFDIKQAGGESLKSYMARFNDATMRVNDLDQKFFFKAFQKGLRVGPFSDAWPFRSLRKREAEYLSKDGRSRPIKQQLLLIGGRELPRRQDLDGRHKIPPKFTPLKEKKAHIMREICHTWLLNFPQAAGGKQMGKNRREWCDFHRAVGHSTEECWTSGAQLEGLVQQGRLRQYVVRTGRERTRAKAEVSGREKRNRGNSGRSRGEELCAERDIQRKRKAHQSYQILTGANLTPLGERRKGCAITFQEKDRRCEAAGDEPMVISMVVEDFRVERVLIDQGSSTNILYGSTNRRMGLSGLKETPGCLYGFSGERVPIKGTVELDTVFGEGGNAKMIPVLYTVIEVEASYNIIMGRLALNRLRAIVSMYHLCMKYPTGEGVGTVWADSGMAKRCYEDSMRVGQRGSIVNTLSLELDPRCHDERERPHAVEKLKEIQVGLRENQKMKIGTIMTEEQEAELIRCLQRNYDVFA